MITLTAVSKVVTANSSSAVMPARQLKRKGKEMSGKFNKFYYTLLLVNLRNQFSSNFKDMWYFSSRN